MDELKSKTFFIIDFKKLFLFQLALLGLFFYILFTQDHYSMYLLPFFFINLFIFIYLINSPIRLFNFFLIFLPISTIGLFPVFYREMFLYFIPIFGLFFIGVTQFINNSDLRLTWTPISKFIILLFLALIVSLINAHFNGWFSIKLLRQSYTLIQSIILLIVVISVLNDRHKLMKSIEILFFSAGISTLLLLIITFAQGLAFSRRVIVPFADFSLNEVAILFAPYIAIGIVLLWLNKAFKKRLFIILSIIIMVITLIITQSRGAWVAALCSTIYLFYKRRYYRGMLIVVLFVAILFLFSSFRNILSVRLAQFGGGDISLMHRFVLWKTALVIISKNFLFGVGMNNFLLIKYNFGFPAWLDPRMIYHTHNIYLEILTNLGIIGFLGFFGLVIKTFSGLNKITSINDNNSSLLSLGFKAAILTFLIHGLVDSGLFRNVTFFSFIVIIGLSLALVKTNDKIHLSNTIKHTI